MGDLHCPLSSVFVPFLTFYTLLSTHSTLLKPSTSYNNLLKGFMKISKYLLTSISGRILTSPSYTPWHTMLNLFNYLGQQITTIQSIQKGFTLIWQKMHTEQQTIGMSTVKLQSGYKGKKKCCNT